VKLGDGRGEAAWGRGWEWVGPSSAGRCMATRIFLAMDSLGYWRATTDRMRTILVRFTPLALTGTVLPAQTHV
jgi:hypothetical protein